MSKHLRPKKDVTTQGPCIRTSQPQAIVLADTLWGFSQERKQYHTERIRSINKIKRDECRKEKASNSKECEIIRPMRNLSWIPPVNDS